MRREFVANVSHELKTPLTIIQTSVETLLDGGAAEDPQHRRLFLEQLSIQAQRLHYLITDLLSLARIESGEEVFTFQEVPVAELRRAIVRPPPQPRRSPPADLDDGAGAGNERLGRR